MTMAIPPPELGHLQCDLTLRQQTCKNAVQLLVVSWRVLTLWAGCYWDGFQLKAII